MLVNWKGKIIGFTQMYLIITICCASLKARLTWTMTGSWLKSCPEQRACHIWYLWLSACALHHLGFRFYSSCAVHHINILTGGLSNKQTLSTVLNTNMNPHLSTKLQHHTEQHNSLRDGRIYCEANIVQWIAVRCVFIACSLKCQCLLWHDLKFCSNVLRH